MCSFSSTRQPLSDNSDICIVKALLDMFVIYPVKFTKKNTSFASWRNGGRAPPSNAAAVIRDAVAKNGQNPHAYSLHSLRARGATALYRASMDTDLLARFGRWVNQVDLGRPLGKSSDYGGAKRPNGQRGPYDTHCREHETDGAQGGPAPKFYRTTVGGTCALGGLEVMMTSLLGGVAAPHGGSSPLVASKSLRSLYRLYIFSRKHSPPNTRSWVVSS